MDKLNKELIYRLGKSFSLDEVDFILAQVEASLLDYEVTLKSTAIDFSNNVSMIIAYLTSKKVEGIRDSTIKVYLTELRCFANYFKQSLLSLTTDDIREFLLFKQNSVKPRALEHNRGCIKRFYDWCIIQGYVSKNPVAPINRIKFIHTQVKWVEDYDFDRVKFACRNNLRDTALVDFMLSTGLRASEVCRLKVSDINFDTCVLSVTGKGILEHNTYINTTSKQSLIRYLNGRDNGYLFHGRRGINTQMSVEGLEYIYDKIGKNAGLVYKLKPHMMRHTLATKLIRKGVPVEQVQSILGHSKVDTTMQYIDVDTSAIQQNHALCFA